MCELCQFIDTKLFQNCYRQARRHFLSLVGAIPLKLLVAEQTVIHPLAGPDGESLCCDPAGAATVSRVAGDQYGIKWIGL